jgi:hypothetical protein
VQRTACTTFCDQVGSPGAESTERIIGGALEDQVRLLRTLLAELEALPDTMSPRVLRAEIEVDLAAANDYVARHGSFAELAREHYAAGDDDPV